MIALDRYWTTRFSVIKRSPELSKCADLIPVCFLDYVDCWNLNTQRSVKKARKSSASVWLTLFPILRLTMKKRFLSMFDPC